MPNVLIRAATPEDDRDLAVLDAAAWPPELQVVPPHPADEPFFTAGRRAEDVLVAVLADDSAVPDGGRAVADGNGKNEIVGYAHLARHMAVSANDHVLHFNALAVSPSARGHGVGSRLIAAAIEEARRRGVRKLGLRALSTNHTAIALYTRAGFVEEGRLLDEIRLPDGSYADDLWFRLLLNT